MVRLLLLLLGTMTASAHEPSVSTGTANTPEPSPIMITYIQGRDGLRVETSYNIRWDFGDIKLIYPGLRGFLGNPAKAFRNTTWDITENTRVMLYGVRMNPWKLLIDKESVPTAELSRSTGPAVQAHPAEQRRRFRLSAKPIIDDIRRHVPDDIRRIIVKESFRQLHPDAGRMSYESQRAVIEDMLKVEQGFDIPYLSAPEKGVEYLLDQDKDKH